MDEQNKEPETGEEKVEYTIFNTKEEFVTELDALIVEGNKLKEQLYTFGIRMAKDGMLSSGAADAYVGIKDTVELLEMLKSGDMLEKIEQKLSEQKEQKSIEALPEIPKNLNKYLN